MGGFVFKEARRRIGKSGGRRERSWAVRPKRSPWMTYSVPVVLTMGLWVWSVYISEMSSLHDGGVRTLHAWASGLYRNLVGLRRRSRVWRGRRDGHHPNERGLNVARLMPKVSGDHSEGHGVWIAREDYTSLEICYRDSSVG